MGVDDMEIDRWFAQSGGTGQQTSGVQDELALRRFDRRLRRRIAALTPQDVARHAIDVTVFNHAEDQLRRAREALRRGDHGRSTEFGLRVAAVHGTGDAVLCLVVLYRRLGWGDLADAWLTIAIDEGWEPDDVVDVDQEYRPPPLTTD